MDGVSALPGGAWLDVARSLPPTHPTLPPRAALTALLRRLGVAPEDVAELPDRLDEVMADPMLSWVAGRFTTALRRDVGVLGLPSPYAEPSRAWPVLSPAAGPAASCVYLPGFLATVEDVRRLHRSRGIPDETSWATLSDLGRQLAAHRRAVGSVGLDTQWWLMGIWDGGIVDVGRLQGEWMDERTVGLHIPESGPLGDAAVEASLELLRAEWPGWFGSRPVRAECASWLLDPQLARMLPPTSNIVRFQQRFTLVDGGSVDDDEPLYFVFRRRGVELPAGLSALPRETSLQRAIVDHLLAGGHWQIRRGWLAL